MAMNNIETTYFAGAWDCWNALQAYVAMSRKEKSDAVGYETLSDAFRNLTPTWFINKVKDYMIGRDTVRIGDEVSHIGLQYGQEKYIVIRDLPDNFYEAIGKYGTLKFGKTSIANGSVTKTGKHYDSLPFDYLKSDDNAEKKGPNDA